MVNSVNRLPFCWVSMLVFDILLSEPIMSVRMG